MKINGIDCPDDVDWEALRKRQESQLRAFAIVADICEKHRLHYFLLAGNVLGLKRHGGFIPWDDDIDVGLFRPDYDKLIDILKTDERCHFYNWLCNDDYKLWFTKVAAKTENGTPLVKSDYVDIFPLDRVSSNKFVDFLQKIIVRILVNCELSRKGCQRGYRIPLYGFISFFMPHSVIALRRMLEKWTLNAKRFAYGGIGILLDQYGERARMPHEMWENHSTGATDVLFCGVKCKIPAQSDAYLYRLYGNWRQLPPFEARRPKHEGDDPWIYSEMTSKSAKE